MSDSGESDVVHCPQCRRDLSRADSTPTAGGRMAWPTTASGAPPSGRKRAAGGVESPSGVRRRCRCPRDRSGAPTARRSSRWRCSPAPRARTRASASGFHTYCLPCHNARGNETKQRLYGGSREYHLRRRYGVGQVDFDEMLAGQGGVCAICGAPDPQHVDHDHRTGWVRGILCFNCNGGLGQFRDNPVFLAEAITYLKGTTWQRVLIHPGVFQMCSPMRGRPPSRSS